MTVNIQNKKARFEYELLDFFTAGMQLLGTEIKSIRQGKASIQEGFCFCCFLRPVAFVFKPAKTIFDWQDG